MRLNLNGFKPSVISKILVSKIIYYLKNLNAIEI